MTTVLTVADLRPAAAEIFVATAACVILLVDAFLPEKRRGWSFLLSIAALAGAAWVTSLVAVPERHLQGALHGFGSGVAEETPL